MEHARTDQLVYADDDIEAWPEWLERIHQAFSDPSVGLVGGRNLPRFETPPPAWIERLWAPNSSGERVCAPLSIIDLGDEPRVISPYYVFGCNLSVRRCIVAAAGGFNPDGMPKDLVRFRGDGETSVSRYVQRLGLVAKYDPRASIFHWVPQERMRVEYFENRAFNEGVSISFSRIRERRGVMRLDDRLMQSIREIRVRLRNYFAPFPTERIAEAKRRGFRFHQLEYARDPQVREWLHRVNYINRNGAVPCIDSLGE